MFFFLTGVRNKRRKRWRRKEKEKEKEKDRLSQIVNVILDLKGVACIFFFSFSRDLSFAFL